MARLTAQKAPNNACLPLALGITQRFKRVSPIAFFLSDSIPQFVPAQAA